MRLYLLSDNSDSLLGLRLAGIEGELIGSESGFKDALEGLKGRQDIGLIFVTRLLAEKYADLLLEYKKDDTGPLVVEVPDRHGFGGEDFLSDYLKNTIGLSL
ncbi:MAG TPA: V-type ATP synthase subunit F [Clostridiales bacterium]|jgi:V/A-type H+-transporting ATPase subunit F|nr:V-type ATP synthase subunit F [Clostridiales bacterium]HRT82295.1 V-type ATP synthase subunit F [Oscillospiraceae bacterium]